MEKRSNSSVPPVVPSKEDVHQWIQKDITAASYFLSMLLRYPDIMETMASELYAKVLQDQKGAGIDHVKQQDNGSNKGSDK